MLGFPTSDTLPRTTALGSSASFAKLAGRTRRLARRDLRAPRARRPRRPRRDLREVAARWEASAAPLGLVVLGPARPRRAPGADLNDFAVVSEDGEVTSRGAIVATDAARDPRRVGAGALEVGGLGRAARAARLPEHPTSWRRPTATASPTPRSARSPVTTDATGGGVVATHARGGPGRSSAPSSRSGYADQLGARVLGVPSAAEVDQVVGGRRGALAGASAPAPSTTARWVPAACSTDRSSSSTWPTEGRRAASVCRRRRSDAAATATSRRRSSTGRSPTRRGAG